MPLNVVTLKCCRCRCHRCRCCWRCCALAPRFCSSNVWNNWIQTYHNSQNEIETSGKFIQMIAQMADIVNCDNTMHILYMYLLDGFDTKQWHLVGAGAGAGAPPPTHTTRHMRSGKRSTIPTNARRIPTQTGNDRLSWSTVLYYIVINGAFKL